MNDKNIIKLLNNYTDSPIKQVILGLLERINELELKQNKCFCETTSRVTEFLDAIIKQRVTMQDIENAAKEMSKIHKAVAIHPRTIEDYGKENPSK